MEKLKHAIDYKISLLNDPHESRLLSTINNMVFNMCYKMYKKNDESSIHKYYYNVNAFRLLDKIIQQFSREGLTWTPINYDCLKSVTGICPDCGTKLALMESGSMFCSECHLVNEAVVNIVDHCESRPASVHESHSGKYIIHGHFSVWLKSSQGHDCKGMPEAAVSRIKESLGSIREITRELIKIHMRDLKMSDYFQSVPYVYYRITQKPLPILRDKDVEHIEAVFARVKELVKTFKHKITSHGYNLYKIAEYCFNSDDTVDPYVKKEFLDNIFLQQPAKLRENDMIWKEVCRLTDIPFIPTVHR